MQAGANGEVPGKDGKDCKDSKDTRDTGEACNLMIGISFSLHEEEP
jgi:hypothetical protein